MVSIGRRRVLVIPLQLAEQHLSPAAEYFHMIVHMNSNSLGIVLIEGSAFACNWLLKCMVMARE